MAAKTSRVGFLLEAAMADDVDSVADANLHRKRRLTREELGDLIKRLTKATTAHAMRSRLWSNDRVEYEERAEAKSVLKKDEDDATKTRGFPKMYPGPRATAESDRIQDIVHSVNRPTHSSDVRQRRLPARRAGGEDAADGRKSAPAGGNGGAEDADVKTCQRCKSGRKTSYQPRPRSRRETDELTQRLVARNFNYELRERDAHFIRSGEEVYYIQLPQSALKPNKSFVRGGLYYKCGE